MLPSETMIWQPEFTDKTLSRKPGAVQSARVGTITFGGKDANSGELHNSSIRNLSASDSLFRGDLFTVSDLRSVVMTLPLVQR
ncbi:hypothetical protein AWP86_08190 [Escherichia coli]|nr:hypothetical protein AWP86_08190 [Escherichia coli]